MKWPHQYMFYLKGSLVTNSFVTLACLLQSYLHSLLSEQWLNFVSFIQPLDKYGRRNTMGHPKVDNKRQYRLPPVLSSSLPHCLPLPVLYLSPVLQRFLLCSSHYIDLMIFVLFNF